jgi:cysteine desulfurase family protein (TIGR01976 family)
MNATPEEIAFGANMTTLTHHLARSIGRGLSPGDEIVVTELDHHANVDPWVYMAKERGLTLHWVRLDRATGRLNWDHLEETLTPTTRVLAIGAASNALGTVTDIAKAVQLAHRYGALVYVDAVHFAPHRLVDVQAMGCDFLACSAYKFYGPHVGVVFGRRRLLKTLDTPRLVPASDEAPERVESGTLNHEGIVGAAAAVEWLASLGRGDSLRERLTAAYRDLHERGMALFERLWAGLSALDGVRCYGPPPGTPRTPTAAFTVADHTPEAVSRHLASRGVFTSHGDFYAATVVVRLGVAPHGLVRAGCSCYTTEEEVDRLVEGVAELVTSRSGPAL